MTHTITDPSKEQLQDVIKKIKYRYFRYRASKAPGCNGFLGTHGKNPKACMACVSTIVASVEFGGKFYFGVSFRNNKDQVNRNIGKLIARNRLLKNIGESWDIDPNIFRESVRNTYESGPHFNIKLFWKELVEAAGCY